MDASYNTSEFTHAIKQLKKKNIKYKYENHILISQGEKNIKYDSSDSLNCYRGARMGFNRRFVSRVGSDEAIGPGILYKESLYNK